MFDSEDLLAYVNVILLEGKKLYFGVYFSPDWLLRLFKKRDRATIIADILKSVSFTPKGRRKTNIMQSANLSSTQVNKYLDLLMRNGYVIVDGYLYRPTSRGLRFLHNLESDYLRLKIRR